jgi:hypothetical protein
VSLLGRLIVILFACLLASFTAGLVVSLAILIPVVGDLALGPFGEGTFGVLVAFGAIFVSAYALVPALLVVSCSAAFSIRMRGQRQNFSFRNARNCAIVISSSGWASAPPGSFLRPGDTSSWPNTLSILKEFGN